MKTTKKLEKIQVKNRTKTILLTTAIVEVKHKLILFLLNMDFIILHVLEVYLQSINRKC